MLAWAARNACAISRHSRHSFFMQHRLCIIIHTTSSMTARLRWCCDSQEGRQLHQRRPATQLRRAALAHRAVQLPALHLPACLPASAIAALSCTACKEQRCSAAHINAYEYCVKQSNSHPIVTAVGRREPFHRRHKCPPPLMLSRQRAPAAPHAQRKAALRLTAQRHRLHRGRGRSRPGAVICSPNPGALASQTVPAGRAPWRCRPLL